MLSLELSLHVACASMYSTANLRRADVPRISFMRSTTITENVVRLLLINKIYAYKQDYAYDEGKFLFYIIQFVTYDYHTQILT
jgi:hypothetical protein